MRTITTTIAAALVAASSPAPVLAATYLGFAPESERYAGYHDPAAHAPVVDELVGYAVATIETFPNVGGRLGDAVFTVRPSRAGRSAVRDEGRYLSNFRIPANVQLSRARAPSREGAADTPTLAVIPEPATWALLILGFGLVAGARRSRRGLREHA